MPSNIRAIPQYIHLPTAGGPSDRFRAGQPLSAGTMQIACSNAELLARENSLSTWWEYPGAANIAGTLGFARGAGAGTTADDFDWDADPSDAASVWVAMIGPRRVRPYGSTGLLPKLVLHGYASCGGGDTAGIIMVARPRHGRPEPGDPSDVKTVTSGTLTSFECTIALQPQHLGSRMIAPMDERTVGASPIERGVQTELVVYIGVYTLALAGKASVRGLSLYLDVPA